MNKDDLFNRHQRLRDGDIGEQLLKNPDVIWQTSDFISKLSRRCRKCYSKYMNDVLRGIDTNTQKYYENALCESCFKLYESKIKKING